jgi:hypothetical protein
VYKWLWASSCQLKHKVFFCLLLKNRLNTRNLLRRKNMALDLIVSFACYSRRRNPDTFFFKCPFVKNCWNRIGVTPPTWLKPDRAARHIKSSLKVPFAMDIIILMFWSIWTQINAWLFNQGDPHVTHRVTSFKREFGLVIQLSKKRWTSEMELWISEFKISVSFFSFSVQFFLCIYSMYLLLII